MENRPFVFGVSTFGDNFTDRVSETERLKNNFVYGVNTIIISPRRWGKTSLVKKVSNIANSDKLKVVYLDIFSCRTDKEFYDTFATTILKETSSKFEEFAENAKSFLSRIIPNFSVGLDPATDFSLSFEFDVKNNYVEDILNLPEKIAQKKGIRIVVCIDEFQQIAEFADSKTFQKKLRTAFQSQSSVSYCLFGSKKHLMNELFESKSLPFYKFGDSIYLPKISTDNWVEYICERFNVTGKHISPEFAEQICEKVSNHSHYVQQLSWLVWIYTTDTVSQQNMNDGFRDLIDQNSLLFEKLTENLSSYQLNFLYAVSNGVTSEFAKQEVIKRCNLGSSANVAVIKRALIKKDLIEIENKEVVLTDPVMGLWLISRT